MEYEYFKNSMSIQIEDKRNIKLRAYWFGISIIKFLKLLPSDYIHQTIGKQLLRSGTSIGANIIEAQAGRSRKDFTNYYQISLKSCNETKYWLLTLKEILTMRELLPKNKELIQESVEIAKMLTASILTLKGEKKTL